MFKSIYFLSMLSLAIAQIGIMPISQITPTTTGIQPATTGTQPSTTSCRRCPANEVYSECGNNACQNTCENPNIGMLCKPICTPGCICRNGYLRNTKGICVRACYCDTCGPYEVFDLKRNTECANTCAEPYKEETCTPNMPLAGCICRSGYVRNIYGKCIRSYKCPRCGENEVFACGSACDTTCATLGETCPIVNIKCNEKCYCIDGYARDDDGVCIPIDQCPPKQCKTDPNAFIAPCGDPCPTTCENRFDTEPRVCMALCIVNGCKCKEGYVLGPDNLCIRPKYCPAPVPTLTCKKYEEYVTCPPSCPPEMTCDSYMSGFVPLCPVPAKPINCTPACRCKAGYVRNSKGCCVLPKNCCTDPNAELVSCPNPCPGGTCENPEFAPCKMMCRKYGCQCKAGYVKRSSTDPTCIPKCRCPCN